MEIYEEPGSGKWKSEIVSRFDANQKGFIPNWRRESPTAKMVMRLRINDLVRFSDDQSIFRLQKISGKELTLAQHNEANVAERHNEPNDPFKYLRTSVTSFQKRGAIKLNISPTGLTLEG